MPTPDGSPIHITPEGRVALRKSIQHWKNLLDGTDDNIGPLGCDLCQLYNQAYRESLSGSRTGVFPAVNCAGCPVQATTGKDCCAKTPYEHVNDLVEDNGGDIDLTDERMIEAITAELRFLESIDRDNPEEGEPHAQS